MPETALSRDSFKGLPDLRREKVNLPARNGFVFVREMSAAEMLEFSSRVKEDPAKAGIWLLCRSVVDASGKRLFDDSDGLTLAESINRDEFDLLNVAMMRLNGLDESTEKK